MSKNKELAKIDELIDKFKDIKEKLNKGEEVEKAVDSEGKELPYWHPKVMAEHNAKMRTQERTARIASLKPKPPTPGAASQSPVNVYDLGDGTGRKYANIPDKPAKIPNTIKSEETIKTDKNGQWSLDKSNYGPRGAAQYNPADNAKRKANNAGSVAELGTMGTVKDYGGNGGPNKMHEEMKRLKAMNRKQPIKTAATDPAIAARIAESKKNPEPIKKSWGEHLPFPGATDVVVPELKKAEDLMANQLANLLLNKSVTGPTPPAQPTDEQMFGGGVVTEEMAKAAEEEWKNKFNSFFVEAQKPAFKQPMTPEEEAAEIERIRKIPVNPGSY